MSLGHKPILIEFRYPMMISSNPFLIFTATFAEIVVITHTHPPTLMAFTWSPELVNPHILKTTAWRSPTCILTAETGLSGS